MSLVERFFGELTADCIRDGSFRNVQELTVAFLKYLAKRNEDPKRYVWKAKVKRSSTTSTKQKGS
jgi:hypothetical protein